MTKKQKISDKEFAIEAARLADERHCRDIIILDLHGKSPATNYFIIATSTSDRQARSVCDDITELARENGLMRIGKAGYEQGKWILVDFIDIILHIFDEEYREYYDLEMLWGDAKKIKF